MAKKANTELTEAQKRSRRSKRSRQKGHAYELQIVHELTALGFGELKTSRNESRTLDDAKIDIADIEGRLPCYFQIKKTKVTPSIKKLNREVGKKDKPLCIMWNIQETKEGNVNTTSAGEYAIIPKSFFYELLSLYNENR